MPYAILLIAVTCVAAYFQRNSLRYALCGFFLGILTFLAFYWLVDFAIWAHILPSNIPTPSSIGEIRPTAILGLGIAYMAAGAVVGAGIELAASAWMKKRNRVQAQQIPQE